MNQIISKIKKLVIDFYSEKEKVDLLYSRMNNINYTLRRLQLEDKLLNSTIPGITDKKYCDCDIIVSLTSYGRRLHDVCFAIESIMQQTMKPNRIVLWVDRSIEIESLPESLRRQQKRGLEIKQTEDIRSYKKLIPALKEYPEDAIITIDDDAIYDFDIIERLIKAYLKAPTMIHACRMHVMRFDDSGKLMPYKAWYWESDDAKECRHRFFTSGGGVLYPRHSLDDEVLNQDVFTSICPTADDVWLNAMAIKKGTAVNKVETRNHTGEDYILNAGVQNMALSKVNNGAQNLNDKQIKAVFEKYKIYDKLRAEEGIQTQVKHR